MVGTSVWAIVGTIIGTIVVVLIVVVVTVVGTVVRAIIRTVIVATLEARSAVWGATIRSVIDVLIVALEVVNAVETIVRAVIRSVVRSTVWAVKRSSDLGDASEVTRAWTSHVNRATAERGLVEIHAWTTALKRSLNAGVHHHAGLLHATTHQLHAQVVINLNAASLGSHAGTRNVRLTSHSLGTSGRARHHGLTLGSHAALWDKLYTLRSPGLEERASHVSHGTHIRTGGSLHVRSWSESIWADESALVHAAWSDISVHAHIRSHVALRSGRSEAWVAWSWHGVGTEDHAIWTVRLDTGELRDVWSHVSALGHIDTATHEVLTSRDWVLDAVELHKALIKFEAWGSWSVWAAWTLRGSDKVIVNVGSGGHRAGRTRGTVWARWAIWSSNEILINVEAHSLGGKRSLRLGDKISVDLEIKGLRSLWLGGSGD